MQLMRSDTQNNFFSFNKLQPMNLTVKIESPCRAMNFTSFDVFCLYT